MEDAAGDFAIANEDASVQTVVNSVPWLEHRAELANRGVDAHEFRFIASRAISTFAYDWHFAVIYLALDSGYGITSFTKARTGVLKGMANMFVIDEKMADNVVWRFLVAFDNDIHCINKLTF